MPNPTTAAQWAATIPVSHINATEGDLRAGRKRLIHTLESYARQQVEAALAQFCDCGESAAGGTQHAQACRYNQPKQVEAFRERAICATCGSCARGEEAIRHEAFGWAHRYVNSDGAFQCGAAAIRALSPTGETRVPSQSKPT